jgi:hypothetical protein
MYTRSTVAWVPFCRKTDRHTHQYYMCVLERQPVPGRLAYPVSCDMGGRDHYRDRAFELYLVLAVAMSITRRRLAGALVVMVHRQWDSREAHPGGYEYNNNENADPFHILPPHRKARSVGLPTRPMFSGTRRIENQRRPLASIAKIHRRGRTHIHMKRSMAYHSVHDTSCFVETSTVPGIYARSPGPTA